MPKKIIKKKRVKDYIEIDPGHLKVGNLITFDGDSIWYKVRAIALRPDPGGRYHFNLSYFEGDTPQTTSVILPFKGSVRLKRA